jgi:hypothetical protein
VRHLYGIGRDGSFDAVKLAPDQTALLWETCKVGSVVFVGNRLFCHIVRVFLIVVVAGELRRGRAATRVRQAWRCSHTRQALPGHPNLWSIDVGENTPDDQAAAGVALGALVAANAPALHTLNVHNSGLGDKGLGPLVDALPPRTRPTRTPAAANALVTRRGRLSALTCF